MAIYYSNQLYPGETLTGVTSGTGSLSATSFNVTQVAFTSASSNPHLVFNTSSTLTTAAAITATFANTAGVSVSSGTGKVVFNRGYNNTPAYIVYPDRSSFATVLLSAATTLSLTANGYEAWGNNEIRLRNLGYF
jgi:hypothetical protein